MARMNEIVDINISRETQGVSRQGFGTALFIGSKGFDDSDRIRTYSSIQGVEEDFAEGDAELVAARRFFGQQVSPTYIKIGYKEDMESLTEAYTEIKKQDADFFFVTAESRDKTEVEDLAEQIESESRIFGTSTSDEAATGMEETDIGSTLQTREFAHTFVIYAEDETELPECAIIGLQAPKQPGASTWKFKTLSGVTRSKLSTTDSLTLKGTQFEDGKGYNTYEEFGGRSIFSEGKMVDGEFIDTIRFSLWLEARMRERIFMTLANSEKIPYTSSGFATIEGRMREVLNEGIAVGGLSDYSVEVPNPREVDPNLRANRVAEGFKFEGTLAGGIHFVKVRGTLVL